MRTSHIINGAVLGLFFIGTVSFGQFVQPLGNPLTGGTNASPPLNESAANQIKEGDLGVEYFVGTAVTNALCMGVEKCISTLWPAGPLASTCKLEVKRWKNFGAPTPGLFGVYNGATGHSCDDLLTESAREDGWVATSHDSCYISLPNGQSNNSGCEGQHQCHFTRVVCTGSAVVKDSETAYFMDSYPPRDEFPLTGQMTGDSYQTFMRSPQCNDGIDQPNPDADVLIDYPADLQCSNYADDDETN